MEPHGCDITYVVKRIKAINTCRSGIIPALRTLQGHKLGNHTPRVMLKNIAGEGQVTQLKTDTGRRLGVGCTDRLTGAAPCMASVRGPHVSAVDSLRDIDSMCAQSGLRAAIRGVLS